MRGVLGIVLLSGMAAAAQSGVPWREAPEYARVLAPSGDRAAAYRVYVSALDIQATLDLLDADTTLVRAPGAWQPRPVSAIDAFGQAGGYNRSTMVRVYGSRQPQVARGARRAGGRVVESWTLISPYPDAGLSRLEPGTLLVVLRLP